MQTDKIQIGFIYMDFYISSKLKYKIHKYKKNRSARDGFGKKNLFLYRYSI
jgi:hypothetical protein